MAKERVRKRNTNSYVYQVDMGWTYAIRGKPSGKLYATIDEAYKAKQAALLQFDNQVATPVNPNPKPILDPDKCGTYTQYNEGCRCDLCTQANRDYKNEQNKRKREVKEKANG